MLLDSKYSDNILSRKGDLMAILTYPLAPRGELGPLGMKFVP
jgi:hypothetical protein